MRPKSIQRAGTLTLIGSGEMSPAMGKVHREVMSRISEQVRAIFLDTPAGFELNADQISARAVAYFKRRLNIELDIATFKSVADATPAEVESAVAKLLTANYIFAGPGSPTYAVRNWRDTVILEAVARRLANGAHLVLASAAAIAIGRYALPVYEIYKVGAAPHWVEGLDLLGAYGFELAVVPHWNNAEGGTHDTRYCFMGEPRLRLLEQRLPSPCSVLGIDENTACVLDLDSGDVQVMGAGQVTIRRSGCEDTFSSGTVFRLGQLAGVSPWREQNDVLAMRIPLRKQEQSYKRPPDGGDQPGIRDDDLMAATPFIELLVAVRDQLRKSSHWGLADEIREQLSSLGIILEDGTTGTTWRRD
jgi:hypothetical protein